MVEKVIAVANCKGGTGKTTTAVNLAAELAYAGRRVLLVDLDTQGHAGLGYGVFSGQQPSSAHSIFQRSASNIKGSIQASGIESVDILPAYRDFKIHTAANDPHRLADALAALGDRYDVVVIDTPPSADLPLVAALTSATFVLVPTQLHHLAHDGLQQFSRLFFSVSTRSNPRLSGFAIVPIQIDMRTNLQRFILAKLLQEFGPARIFRGIRPDIALAEAFGSRRPVRYYRPGCRGNIDYTLLTNDVLTFWAI